MATEVVRVTCDRCAKVLIVEPVKLVCMTHCLREAKPQHCLELCPKCFLGLRLWTREGGSAQ